MSVMEHTETQTVCGMCGHEMALAKCGHGEVTEGAAVVHLCHTDSHDCYHRWTVYGERPVTEDDDRLAEIEELVAAFGNVTPREMTAFFYMHAYNELDLAVRDLLKLVRKLRG